MSSNTRKEKYAGQVWSAVHKVGQGTMTLALTNALVMIGDRDDVPMHELHAPYSGFFLALLDNSSSAQKIMRVCLRAAGSDDDVSTLLSKYQVALGLQAMLFKDEMLSCAEEASGGKSPAYTTVIRVGKLQGKTPAQLILENPDNAESLSKTRDWLQDNLAKYPKNKDMIEAIDDALELYNIGELFDEAPKEKKEQVYKPFLLYEETEKVISARTGDGKRTKCGLRVQYEHGKSLPWTFSLSNADFYEEQGSSKRSPYTDSRSGTIRLNDKEMAAFMRKMESELRSFEAVAYDAAETWMAEHDM